MGEISDIVRGASPRPIKDPKWFDSNSDTGWLRISDVTNQNGRIHNLDQHISKLAQEKTRVLDSPHLLLSIAATVGKPVVNYVKTGVHDGFLIFLKPKFNQEFMFQWLEMYQPKWKKYGQPGSQVNLNSDLVKNQNLTLPNINEQKIIGQLFNQIDNLVDLQQEQLDLYIRFKQGLIQKIFPYCVKDNPQTRFNEFDDTWELHKLGYEFKRINERNNGSFGKNKWISVSKMYFQDPDKVQSNNIYTRTYIMRRGDIAFEGHPNKKFKFGRFVVNDIGDGIVSELFPIYKHIVEYDNNYWKYAIQLERIMAPIFAKSITSSGNSSNKLDSQHFLKQRIPIPKLNEQYRIGNLLKSVDTRIILQQKNIKYLKSLKKYYLQKLFI